ncbi:helix-turn-helix transcriptional regulator [Marinomonas epiphytica]
MHLNMHEVYNKDGKVHDALAPFITGHKRRVSLLPKLHLVDQHLNCEKDITFTETAAAGLYFSFLGEGPIQDVDDIQSVQISYQAKNVSGEVSMPAQTQRSLMQIQITTDQLANILGETEDQIVQHFSAMQTKLGFESQVIRLPLTDKTSQACAPIFSHTGHSISLAGHLYNVIFSLIEQLQMLNHLSGCADCQSKVFQAQNLLEAPLQGYPELKHLAQKVGLNQEALAIGFYFLAGQDIESYYLKNKLQFAATQLRKNPGYKQHILEQSGFSEDQFEAEFRQHFGVSTQQYAQIH